MQLKEENLQRVYASLLTFLVVGLLLLLTLLIVFITPLPPYPEGGGGGIGVNFGTALDGEGDVQPEEYYPIETTVITSSTNQSVNNSTTVSNSDKIITQDIEDAPSVATSDKPNKNKDIKPEIEQTKTIKIAEPVVNPLAVYKKKTQGLSEGETKGTGDQGDPLGSTNVKTHQGVPGYGQGGSGTGSGIGSGSGSGVGSGSGSGSGNGNGVSFSLKGRKFLELKKPDYTIQDQGKVVVKIVVNQDGNVVSATPGQQGSTTTNQDLYKLAEFAAMRSKFDKNPDAPEQQQGTITYIFIRQN